MYLSPVFLTDNGIKRGIGLEKRVSSRRPHAVLTRYWDYTISHDVLTPSHPYLSYRFYSRRFAYSQERGTGYSSLMPSSDYFSITTVIPLTTSTLIRIRSNLIDTPPVIYLNYLSSTYTFTGEEYVSGLSTLFESYCSLVEIDRKIVSKGSD